MKKIILAFATGLGSGYLPFAPGFGGTGVGLLLYLSVKDLSPLSYLSTSLSFLFFSVWIAGAASSLLGKKDPSVVVIDEIAGFLVVMALIPFTWKGLLIGFVLFRIFDVAKPWPCRLIQDKVPGGWGIVGDDLMAAIYSNLLLRLLQQVGS
jgi:phosphatidylglycerophosphatase A